MAARRDEVQQSTDAKGPAPTEGKLHHLGLAAPTGASRRAARLVARYGIAKNRLRATGWVSGYRRSRWKWYPVRPALRDSRLPCHARRRPHPARVARRARARPCRRACPDRAHRRRALQPQHGAAPPGGNSQACCVGMVALAVEPGCNVMVALFARTVATVMLIGLVGFARRLPGQAVRLRGITNVSLVYRIPKSGCG